MAQGSGSLHESVEKLGPETIERHRAIVSLMEELEAVDWYDQRVDATEDDALRAILAHNRDEEKEHAAMTLEWLRRNDPKWNEQLTTYLFTEGPITEIEESDTGEAPASSSDGDGSLGIGSLKESTR
ncbi:MAG: ferritin-like domain-containing protein [Planctomycetota bacterium]